MKRTRTRNNRCFRPRFDILETRLALAVAVTQGDFDGNGTQDLRIIGDADNQTVTINDNASSITLTLDANSDGDLTDSDDMENVTINQVFETFEIQLGEGSDVVTFFAPTADYTNARKSLLVDLGKQADSFQFIGSGGRNIVNSSVTIDVVGGGGADSVSASFADITNSAVSINFDLLGGADGGNITFFGDITAGSVVDAHVDLGAKSNSYSVDVGPSGTLALDNATLSIDLTGSTDPLAADDISLLTVVRAINGGTLLTKADLGAGNDILSAELDVQLLDIDAASLVRYDLNGDEGNDKVELLPRSTANSTTDVAGVLETNVSGGAGADSITVVLGTTAANTNLDLDGTYRVRISGGSENDQIAFTFGTDTDSTGNLDVVILGNAGADQLAYNLRDEGNTNFGPVGFALVDGGFGNDSLTSNTSGAGFSATSLKLRNGIDPTGLTPGVFTGDFDGNGTPDLRIVGNDGINDLLVRDDDGPKEIEVQLDLNDDGDFADPGEFNQVINIQVETVYIQMLGGNDNVRYEMESTFNGTRRSFLIDLGKQADTLTVAPLGTANVSTSALTMEVIGGGGGDNVTVQLSAIAVDQSVLSIDLDLGGGSDSATVFQAEVDEGSVVDVRAALGAGAANTFDLEVLDDIRGGSTLQLQVSGGNVATERDSVLLGFRSSAAATAPIAVLGGSRLFVDASLQAGNDVFNAIYDLFRIDIDAASAARYRIKAGDGNDLINASRTETPPNDNVDIFGLWSIDFAGGLGSDSFTLDLRPNDSNPGNALELDGTLRYRGHGGGDNDNQLINLGTASVSTGKLDLIAQGSLGNDAFTFLFNDAGNETFVPSGFMLFDGGLGADTVTVTGSGAGFDANSVRKRNHES